MDDGDKGDAGDEGEDPRGDRDRYDHAGYLRTTFMQRALNGVIALVAIAAVAASIPYWGGDEFPVTGLIVYVAGMVFVGMPLCMVHESLLASHRARVARARHDHDAAAAAIPAATVF